MLCTNSFTTSFVGDIIFLSFWIWEISRCFSSAAIVTQPALSHFANLLDSSKFIIFPFVLLKMLAFFGDIFPLKSETKSEWDETSRLSSTAAAAIFTFFDYVSQIFDGLVHLLKLVEIKNHFGILQINPQIPREWVGNFDFLKNMFGWDTLMMIHMLKWLIAGTALQMS